MKVTVVTIRREEFPGFGLDVNEEDPFAGIEVFNVYSSTATAASAIVDLLIEHPNWYVHEEIRDVVNTEESRDQIGRLEAIIEGLELELDIARRRVG